MNPLEVEIPVGWGTVRAQVFGDPNKKPLLALHGFLDNSNSYKPLSPYLTDNENYYIIAIDLPGMGFSSCIPQGVPYSTKFFLMSIRSVVLHFKLDKFMIIAHSFGCSLALAYSACYYEHVLGLILLDFAMKDCNFEKSDSISECWREGIETYLTSERKLEEKRQSSEKRELTYEHALKRLLESNKHIDEDAAKLLLERGLTLKENKYEYSRDIRLVSGTSMRDYHSEYSGIYQSLIDNIDCPVVLLYATPSPFGEKLFEEVMHIMSRIKKSCKKTVESIPIEGTHHFHMLKPNQTAQPILKFLKQEYMESPRNDP